MILFRVPLHAWPSLLRYSLARRLAVGRRPPTPELSDSDLDFFLGGTEAAQTRFASPTFQFFSPANFGPAPTAEVLDSLRRHRVTLLGQTFDIGQPIEWRRDFRTGHQWSRDHISQLKLTTTQGDVKVPWELSRFQHGLTLALGYAASGDRRYVDEWIEQFLAWRVDNPPEHGPNWGNAMEAAIRTANWIAAYEFLRPTLSRPTQESFYKALIQHGRFIFSHLEQYWPPTNHILADLCGLIWIGLFLRPDSKNESASREPQRWLDYGLSELQKQLRFQILPDGASYEASTAYHHFVTEMVSSTVRLCELNSIFVPPALRQIVSKMESVAVALQKPDGSLPLFGDEDGGKFPSPKWGKESAVKVDGWSAFPQAGWYIFRNSDEYLAVHAGDNSQAGWGGHAHNDALSFEYTIGPRTFLIDPGTYTYTADPDSRNLFRSTAYHNTVRVDRQEISRLPPAELFRLENDVKVKVEIHNDTWLGQHSGYQRLSVIHARRFAKTETGWQIIDSFTGSGEHELDWFFHFAPDSPVKVDGLRCWTEFSNGPNLSLTFNFHAEHLTSSLQSGWVSPTYGMRLPAVVARFALKSKTAD